MTEARKTAAFAGIALVLVAVAWATLPRPRTPEALQDRGQPFFPEFTDPNAAASLEVVEYDEQTSVARPFKVENREGRWIIPSHQSYPADARNRLSAIAGAVIALKKDDVASENAGDHERCGVLDPLDETLPALTGRGTRITVRGKNDRMLADIIAGKPVDGRPAFRYVRLPGQRRTYIARVDNLDASTKFEDWIERNLLQVAREEIDQIVVRNYATDPKSGDVNERETLVLRKKGPDAWALDGVAAGEAIDTFPMNLLVTRLIDLTIEDVRPKPPGLIASLSAAGGTAKLTKPDLAELGARGFYFTSDGQMLSNEGEVLVHTSTGIFYVLRFGEIAYGTASAASRYVFISASVDPKATNSAISSDTRNRLDVLRARFAPWYYVVSDDSFRKIRLTRNDLVKARARTQP